MVDNNSFFTVDACSVIPATARRKNKRNINDLERREQKKNFLLCKYLPKIYFLAFFIRSGVKLSHDDFTTLCSSKSFVKLLSLISYKVAPFLLTHFFFFFFFFLKIVKCVVMAEREREMWVRIKWNEKDSEWMCQEEEKS